MERVILHCDLNSFFSSVELLDHPELRHLPVAVCGDPTSRHGIILAKNELAKRFGVKMAETVWQAQKKCPELVLLAPHREKYEYYSRRVGEIYGQYTDLVEPFGIDESWLDVTGTLHLFGGDARALADQIRERVRRELRLTISVGVSYNKVFAKLGSDYKKPDATTVITRENMERVVWPLPVGNLLFVGQAALRELERYGVHTIGELAHFDRTALERLLGRAGGQMHDYANGLDVSRVRQAGLYVPPKSVGNGMTFEHDLVGEQEVRSRVTALADCVAARLRRHALRCTTVQVGLRSPQFHDITRQRRLERPTYLTGELVQSAMGLICDNWDLSSPIRAITITGMNLVVEEAGVGQITLFSDGREACYRYKQEKLARTIDDLRDRFGGHSVIPLACILRGGVCNEDEKQNQFCPISGKTTQKVIDVMK